MEGELQTPLAAIQTLEDLMIIRNMVALNMKNLFAMPLVLCLISCTHLTGTKLQNVSVTLPGDHKMHFSGKGAGAGMMLMSSMGPMGIAIGVAIDEGIAKDIAKAGEAAKLDLPAIVKKAFEPYSEKGISIEIQRYGFLISPKGGDLAIPQLHLAVLPNMGDAPNIIRIPEEIPKGGIAGCELVEEDLSDVKVDGALVIKAFDSAAECGLTLYSIVK